MCKNSNLISTRGVWGGVTLYILGCISGSTRGEWGGVTLYILGCISGSTCGVWGGVKSSIP